jgi:hypothetical protein
VLVFNCFSSECSRCARRAAASRVTARRGLRDAPPRRDDGDLGHGERATRVHSKSPTCSSAVSALIAAVRSLLMCARAVISTRIAAPGAVIGAWPAQLAHVQRRNGLGDAASVERVGLTDSAVGAGVHPRRFDGAVAGLGNRVRQPGALGAGPLEDPQRREIAAGASRDPGDRAGQS